MHVLDVPQHRLTIDDVARMAEAGILDPERRYELIDGILFDLTPGITPQHSGAVTWLTRHFVVGCPDHDVRVQDCLFVDGGWLSPDLMVTRPLARDERAVTAELVIEVSVTSHRHDRFKAERYARNGVGEYWIVDEPGRRVHVHADPHPEGYRRSATYADGDTITPPLGAPPVDVSALLGPT